MAQSIRVTIVGDASSLENALNRATGSASRFGRSFSGSVGQWVKGAVVFRGVNLAIDGVVNAMRDGVKGAIEEEAQTKRLTAAFKNQGIAMTATSKQVQALEQAGMKLGFTDDDVRESLIKLTNAGKTYGEATREIAVAQDVARVKGIGLADATAGLIKLQAGQTRAAKEYGIVLPPVTAAVDALKNSHVDLTSEEGKHELALAKVQDKLATGQAYYDALTQKVQGQAQVFAGSAAGGLAQFHAKLDDTEEQLGAVAIKIANAVLPALQSMLGAVSGVISWLQQHKTVAEALAITLGSLAVAVIAVNTAVKIGASVTAAYNAVATASTAALGLFRTAAVEATVAQEGLNVAMRANPYGLVITAVAALAGGLLLLGNRLDTTSGEFNTARAAASAYKSAIDGLKTSTTELSGAHLNVERAELTLERARQNLTTITKTAGRGSLEFRDAQLAVKEAAFALTSAQGTLKTAIDKDAEAKAAASKASEKLKQEIGDLADSFQKASDKSNISISSLWKYHDAIFSSKEMSQKFAGQLAQLSTAAGGSSTELGKATASAAAFADSLNNIPNYKRIVIDVVYQTSGSPPPARASGGPVTGGMPYTVGEHGKEVFVPSISGRIIPNSQLGRGSVGGGNIIVHQHITGSVFTQNELLDMFYEGLLRKQRSNVNLGFT